MHLIAYYCVQVLVLLVYQLSFSTSVPINRESSIQIDLMIDPVHQGEMDEDLEQKRVVVKSVLNVPFISSPSSGLNNRCPSGQARLSSGGPCVQRVVSSGISDDQKLIAELTKEFFNKRKPGGHRRHRTTTTQRTTTTETVPTTTTEVPTTPTEASILHTRENTVTPIWTSAINPSIPSVNPDQVFTADLVLPTSRTTTDDSIDNSYKISLPFDLPQTKDGANSGDKQTSSLQGDEELLTMMTTTEIPYSIANSEDGGTTTINYGMEMITELPTKMPDLLQEELLSSEIPAASSSSSPGVTKETTTIPFEAGAPSSSSSSAEPTELPVTQAESRPELMTALNSNTTTTTSTTTTTTTTTMQPEMIEAEEKTLPSWSSSSIRNGAASSTATTTTGIDPLSLIITSTAGTDGESSSSRTLSPETTSSSGTRDDANNPPSLTSPSHDDDEYAPAERAEMTSITPVFLTIEQERRRTSISITPEQDEFESSTELYFQQEQPTTVQLIVPPSTTTHQHRRPTARAELTFDFIPSPSDIYKATMPPRAVIPPHKLEFPTFTVSSSSGINSSDRSTSYFDLPFQETHHPLRSSLVSYDFLDGRRDQKGISSTTRENFNPSYAFS